MRELAALALLGAVLAGCGDDEPGSGDGGGTVTVFAAASLTDVFTDLGDAFADTHPGVSVELAFGPSSGVVTQITEGAPADVVATAATATMADLVEADAVAGAPRPFATNALELAVPPGNPGAVEGLDDLADEDLVVGLCAEEVPCGSLARQALAAAGVEPAVDTDEPDVRALLTKVAAGEVDVGVVYRTDVVAAGAAVEGIEIAAEDDLVATYPIAPVADAANPDGARAFIDFVLSDQGQATLAEAGFAPAPSS